MGTLTPKLISYRGRFAPSPTGELHWGSLFNAFASFLDARSCQGQWLLRIDDLDPLRSSQQSIDAILFTLERFGLHWDGAVHYQSKQTGRYQQTLEKLGNNGHLYACSCTRKRLKNHRNLNHHAKSPDYPGFCRHKTIDTRLKHALRIKTQPFPVELFDPVQGRQEQVLTDTCGDFIVMRRDNIPAYHLASVVDDFTMEITNAIRGYDLLQASMQQCYLQKLLQYPHPTYIHLPVIIDARSIKLSKQTGAEPVSHYPVNKTLCQLLHQLKQDPPDDLVYQTRETIISWAIEHWDIKRLNGCTEIPIAESGNYINAL